jgi:hypothetical protein
MSLLEVIRNLNDLDDEGTIYAARPWSSTAKALVAQEPEAGGLPAEARNMQLNYFLEVFLARDFLHDLQTAEGDLPDLIAQCERLIRHAETDA